MMNKARALIWSVGRPAATLVLLLGFCARLAAQFDSEREYTFDQVRRDLNQAMSQRDTPGLALAWYEWAHYDEQKAGNRDSVYAYLDKSAALYRQVGDTLRYQHVRAELAERLAAKGLTDEALRMQHEALAYFKRNGDLRLQTQLLAGIYRTWLLKGDTLTAQGWKNDFLNQNKTVKDTVLIVQVMMEEVHKWQKEGRYREAAQLSFLALSQAYQTHRRSLIAEVEFSIGSLSSRAGNYFTALDYLHKAEQSVFPGNYTLRRSIYRELSQTYELVDSLSATARYAIRYGQLGDTLLAGDRAAARVRSALQFDAGKKQREIDSLEQQKKAAEDYAKQQRKAAMAVGAMLLMVLLAAGIMVAAYRQRLRSNRIIAAQTEEINQQKIQALEADVQLRVMQSMMEGQESERKRIANDLHDSLGGLLAVAKIQLENLPAKTPELASSPEWQKLKNLLDDTVAEARHIARNLLPGALLKFGLVAAIQDLVSRVRGEGVPVITFQHFGHFEDLHELLALNCYRIVQELLQNSLKHARANEILVQMTRSGDELALLVEDDGRGFDRDTAPKGMGTTNVAQRVQFLQGELSVQTAPGEGTSVHVSVPTNNTQGFPG